MPMNESTARSILRLVAIVTILIGAVHSAQSGLAWILFEGPIGPSIYVAEEEFLRPVRFSLYQDLVVLVGGYLLWAVSSLLARHVADCDAAQLDAGDDGTSGRSSAS